MAVYRLAKAAQADIIDLLAWTEANFGETARLRYERLLIVALRDIATEPERLNSIARLELGENVRAIIFAIAGNARRPSTALSSARDTFCSIALPVPS